MMSKVLLDYNFATNVNPLGPPEWISQQFSSACNQLSYYSELWHQDLDEVIASHWQIGRDKILITTGSSEFFFQLPHLLNCLQGPWLFLDPTFWEYQLLAKTHSIPFEVFSVADTEEKMFQEVNVLQLLHLAKQINPKIIFICSPNNPTGHLIRRSDICEIAKKLPNTWIIVDQTYAYFLENWIEERLPQDDSPENIVSITSFSKFFCLPGLRICAVGCSSTQRINFFKKSLGPIRVNGIAADLSPNLFADDKYHETTRSHFNLGWPKFLERLEGSLLHPLPSKTIFRLFKIAESNEFLVERDRGDQLTERLINDYGIRVCSGTTYGLKNQVRIRLGTSKANQILISALENIGLVDKPIVSL